MPAPHLPEFRQRGVQLAREGTTTGARWCAGWLLARDGSGASRQALARALKSEPVVENVRAFGLMLNGQDL